MRAQAAVPQRFARLRHAAPAREYVEEARGAQLLDQVADLALRGERGGDEWDEGGLLVQRLVEVLQAKEDGVLLCEGSVKFGLVDKKATRFYYYFFYYFDKPNGKIFLLWELYRASSKMKKAQWGFSFKKSNIHFLKQFCLYFNYMKWTV